jgi:hypothetical protein
MMMRAWSYLFRKNGRKYNGSIASEIETCGRGVERGGEVNGVLLPCTIMKIQFSTSFSIKLSQANKNSLIIHSQMNS